MKLRDCPDAVALVRWQTQYPHLSGMYRYAGISSGAE